MKKLEWNLVGQLLAAASNEASLATAPEEDWPRIERQAFQLAAAALDEAGMTISGAVALLEEELGGHWVSISRLYWLERLFPDPRIPAVDADECECGAELEFVENVTPRRSTWRCPKCNIEITVA